MFRPVRCLALLLTTLLMASGAVAQAPRDRNCTDDNGVDRCAEARQRETRALFGFRSIEEHAEAGDQVRRAFYVDGYGRDLVAIAFVRAPGRDPTAFVHFPRRAGQPATAPLEALVPPAVWADLLTRSANFHRSFTPVPQSGDTLSICLHSWVYTVEANDPARANLAPAEVRRATEDACHAGPAAAFATELQRAALPLFPYCAALDPEQHRGPASQLAACQILRGDRLAAAQALNRAGAFRRVRGPDDLRHLAGIFAARATIDWNGVRSPAADPNPAGFWTARLAEHGGANFYYESVEGLSADRARLRGFVVRTEEGSGGARSVQYRAPVEQIWVLGPPQEFQVESTTVGPWEVYRPG